MSPRLCCGIPVLAGGGGAGRAAGVVCAGVVWAGVVWAGVAGPTVALGAGGGVELRARVGWVLGGGVGAAAATTGGRRP